MAAGLARLASRAAIAEGARRAGREESNLLGTLLGLATEAALVAADRPDTRSWTLLPGRFYAARVPVEPGAHTLRIAIGGTGGEDTFERSVEVAAGGFEAIVITEPR